MFAGWLRRSVLLPPGGAVLGRRRHRKCEGSKSQRRNIAKMRIQCDSCESKFASVMCCADEAALCSDCDARIHSANKLASKHQRVAFLTVSEPSHCDICQVCLCIPVTLDTWIPLQNCSSISAVDSSTTTRLRSLVPADQCSSS